LTDTKRRKLNISATKNDTKLNKKLLTYAQTKTNKTEAWLWGLLRHAAKKQIEPIPQLPRGPHERILEIGLRRNNKHVLEHSIKFHYGL